MPAKGFSAIAPIIIAGAVFLISPFVYKAITGAYPPGFPKSGPSKFLSLPEALKRPPEQKTKKSEDPVKGPQGTPEIFKSLILFEMDDTGSVQKAKELGANAVTLMVDIGVQGDKFALPKKWRNGPFDLEEIVGPFINEAHKQGLYVELRTSQSPFAKSTAQYDQKSVEESFAEVISEFAKLAQKYQVYQLSISIEADTLVGYAYKKAPEGTLNSTLMTRFAKIGKDEAKKYYKGKLGIGLSFPEQHESSKYLSGIDFTGFDYFVFTSYPHPQKDGNIKSYLDGRVSNVLNAARNIAKKNNIPEVIWGETGVLNPGEDMPGPDEDRFYIRANEQEEAGYYENMFTKSKGLVDGYTLFYEFPLFSVKNQQSEAVVKKWFSETTGN